MTCDDGAADVAVNWCMCQVTNDSGEQLDGQDAGGGIDDDDDDGGGVDFGLSVADDVSQSQFVTSQLLDEMNCDGSVLTGDNLLAVPRKVSHPLLFTALMLLVV